MPVYQFDVQFKYVTEYWTNKFFAICTDNSDAREFATSLPVWWIQSLPPSITFEKVRVTPLPFVKNVYFDVEINAVGTAPAYSPAPLFNVVRIDMSKAYGRSVHHYIRGTFPTSAMGANGQFTTEYQGYNNSFAAHLADGPQVVCDKNGNAYARFGASPSVGMRQMRRGSKRKKMPVI